MASTSSVTPSKARAPIFSNLLLSIEKLDGSNYSNRTSEVTLWISRLGYKSHLTSTIDSILVVDRAQWAKIDANLCSVIKSTLHPSLKSIFLPHIICKSVWTEARALYTNDTQQLYGVCQDLMTLLAPQKFESRSYVCISLTTPCSPTWI